MTDKEYGDNWAKDSAYHKSIASYPWMANRIKQGKRILEVGCGNGNSTLELSKRYEVLGLEASEYLSKISKRATKDKSNIEIINISLLDPEAEEHIEKFSPDVIVCWLIGAGPSTISNHLSKPVEEIGGSDVPAYRELVHERCYALGSKYLRKNGLINIIDRLMVNDIELIRSEMRAEHDRLSHQKFLIGVIEFRKVPQVGSSHIQNLVSGNIDFNAYPALCSVSSTKIG